MANREMWAFIGRRLVFGSFLFLALRGVWSIWPNTWTCAAFWAAFYIMPFVRSNEHRDIAERTEPQDWTPLWRRAVCLVALAAFAAFVIGISMNAVVTLANGGFMPVGSVSGVDLGHSVWVRSSDAHRLAWLGDNYVGFSLGDIVGLSGFALMGLSMRLLRGEEPREEPASDVPRGVGLWRVVTGFGAVFLIAPVAAESKVWLMPLGLFVVLYVASVGMEWQRRKWRLETERRDREWREWLVSRGFAAAVDPHVRTSNA